LLRSLVGKSLKDGVLKLPHTEFAFNRCPSYAAKHSPFECVYAVNPLTPLDLLSISTEARVSFEAKTRAKEMNKLHEQIRGQIEKTNEAYKAKANKHCRQLGFKSGDLVWLHLRKERFPLRRKNKLMARSDGPFEVIMKVGNNGYKLQFLGDMAISATFNIRDLSPYVEDTVEDPSDLRSIPFEEGEIDVGAYPQGHSKDNQDQGDQEQRALNGQIQALFSFPCFWVCTVMETHFGDDLTIMIGRVLLCWTP